MQIKIIKDYLGIGEMFKMSKINIKPGVTVIVGCNGYGKSTLLRQIRDYVEKNKMAFLYFDNLSDGGKAAREEFAFRDDFATLATSLLSSEGENIIINLGIRSRRIGDMVRCAKIDGRKDVFVLFDAIDSGLSIDNVNDVKKYLFDVAISDCNASDINIYFVVTANSYALASGHDCIDAISGKHLKFSSYEKYHDYIMNTRKEKENR